MFARSATDLLKSMIVRLFPGFLCLREVRMERRGTPSQRVAPRRPSTITAELWVLVFNRSSVLQGLKATNLNVWCVCVWVVGFKCLWVEG